MLNYDSFVKGFVHPDIVKALTVTDEGGVGTSQAMEQSFRVAQNEAKSFVECLPLSFRGMFDVDTYTIKRALIHIYDYILQNRAELTSLGVDVLNLNDDQVFTHFNDLRNQEDDCIHKMREEAMSYMTANKLRSTSNEGNSSQGVGLRFRVAKNRYTGRYY